MKLNDLCQGIVAEVNGCLGCAVVDLDTGLPLAMQVGAGSSLNPQAMEFISVASVEYFRGKTIWQLGLELSDGADPSQTGFVREIQTTTMDMHHFMAVVPGWEGTLLILITAKSANLGMGWIAMRQALAQIAEAREQERAQMSRDRVAPLRADASISPPGHAGTQGMNPQTAAPGQPGGQPAGADEGPAAPISPGPGYADAESSGEQAAQPSRGPEFPKVKVPHWRGGHGGRGRRTI